MAQRSLRGVSVPPFYAGEIGRRGAARNRAGQSLISMHFGQPAAGAPAAAIQTAHQVLDQDTLGYFESAQLCERLSQHYRETYDVVVSADRILLTAGASAGLVAAYLSLFKTGDRVALVNPGYPAYRNTLSALGMVPVEITCRREDGFKPTPEMLALLDPPPVGFVLASPANPTGVMLDAEEMSAITGYCREHNIHLISDEIYHGITFGSVAVSALELDQNIIVINSFSKLYRMPGWRLGWMVAPCEWVDTISASLMNMFLTPPTLSQHAALAAMGESEDLALAVATYRHNRKILIEGLNALGIDQIAPPDGAFYVYADISHITSDSLQFCIRAVEEIGLGLAPGIDFDPKNGRGFVRFSFAIATAEIEQAIELLGAWIPTYQDAPGDSA